MTKERRKNERERPESRGHCAEQSGARRLLSARDRSFGQTRRAWRGRYRRRRRERPSEFGPPSRTAHAKVRHGTTHAATVPTRRSPAGTTSSRRRGGDDRPVVRHIRIGSGHRELADHSVADTEVGERHECGECRQSREEAVRCPARSVDRHRSRHERNQHGPRPAPPATPPRMLGAIASCPGRPGSRTSDVYVHDPLACANISRWSPLSIFLTRSGLRHSTLSTTRVLGHFHALRGARPRRDSQSRRPTGGRRAG